MSNSEVEIFLIDMKEKNNLIKVPKSIKYEDFIKLIINPNYPDLKYLPEYSVTPKVIQIYIIKIKNIAPI